jgi:hypothetical protein
MAGYRNVYNYLRSSDVAAYTRFGREQMQKGRALLWPEVYWSSLEYPMASGLLIGPLYEDLKQRRRGLVQDIVVASGLQYLVISANRRGGQ